jgi:hypothetical protein
LEEQIAKHHALLLSGQKQALEVSVMLCRPTTLKLPEIAELLLANRA